MTGAEQIEPPLRVLAVCAFPVEAAATRFRLAQFIDPLKHHGIELTISPFLTSEQFADLYRGGKALFKIAGMAASVIKRLAETLSVRRYDLILVQREAMIFGPGVFEWLYSKVGHKRLVLDLDDATYVRYVSPTYGRMGSSLKFFGKTDNLIRRSAKVICGNRFIGEYVSANGGSPIIVPTVVDTELFKPRSDPNRSGLLTVGWIGTHSTFPFLAKLFPVLERLSERFDFELKIVGAGNVDLKSEKINFRAVEWSLDREPEDFSSLDIGLYPIFPEGAASDEWIKGKSGFKAVQYMAVGVPFVMSPVGVCGEIGHPGATHLNAATNEDWYTSLDMLLANPQLRSAMGEAGRQYSVQNFGVDQQASTLADVLKSVASR
jgi:glycosyltransferase involved in cell wall biosynthesis